MDKIKTEMMISMSLKEYESLIEDSQFLAALEAAGVGNWEGYEIAQGILEEWAE